LIDAYQIVKKNLIDKKYLFLNIEYLKSEYQNEKNNLDFKFDS
jgi:hypothetical protein